MSRQCTSGQRGAAATEVPLAPPGRAVPIHGQLLLIALLCLFPRPAATLQLPTPDLRMDAYPTGARPFGVDLVGATPNVAVAGPVSIVVANSGEDSVSIFRVRTPGKAGNFSNPFSLELAATVRGIPSAYAVAACNYAGTGDRALVTSPADNSVVVVSVTDGRILGRLSVGPQPHGVACFGSPTAYKGIVSNAGDDSLVVFDVGSLAVETRITGVAGAKGAHGIYLDPATTTRGVRVWVAGTSADVLSLVDLTTNQVLARLSVRGPTSVHDRCVASALDGGIVCYDESLGRSFTSGIPTPADFINLNWNEIRGQWIFLATTGTNGSVFWRVTGGEMKTLSGIPGAAGLAGYSGGAVTPLFFAVTSPDSNRLFLIQPPPPSPARPSDFIVVNGASFGNAGIAPNSLATVFISTGVLQNVFAGSVPSPKTLGGVSLRVGGSLTVNAANTGWDYSTTGSIEAGLHYVGPGQINFQIPPGIAPGDSVPAQLQLPNSKTLLTTLRLLPSAPGAFTVLMNGQGQAAVLNQGNSQNGDTNLFVGVKPAARGSVIQIFATGAGETTPALAAGAAAPLSGNPLVLTKLQPTVTIGGKNATVQFSGMAPGFVGLWQINAQIPQDVTPGMTVPLVITAGGAASNTVTIAVQ